MKRKPAVGDIQDDAAVFGAHADIGDFPEFRSRELAAIGGGRRRFELLHSYPRFLAVQSIRRRIAFRTVASTILRETFAVQPRKVWICPKLYPGNFAQE